MECASSQGVRAGPVSHAVLPSKSVTREESQYPLPIRNPSIQCACLPRSLQITSTAFLSSETISHLTLLMRTLSPFRPGVVHLV